MEINLKEIADYVQGEIVGREDCIISNVARIEDAVPGDLSFIYQEKFEKLLSSTKASAVIVRRNFEKSFENISLIKVDEPYLAFINVIEKYFLPKVELPPLFTPKELTKIEFTYGENFRCGENVFIGKNCKIGKNVTIFSNTVILEEVEVGDETIIYPNVTIREKCKLGKRNIIHPGAVIGSDGFGYYKNKDKSHRKIPQIGIVVLEDDVEIGANTAIDRAFLGQTLIKRGTKIDNLVQVAHNCVIGEDCALSGQTGLAGSTKLGNRVITGGQVGFAGHLSVGDDSAIGAQSGVAKDLKGGKMYFGAPAIDAREAFKINAVVQSLPELHRQVQQLKIKLEELSKLIAEKLNNR